MLLLSRLLFNIFYLSVQMDNLLLVVMVNLLLCFFVLFIANDLMLILLFLWVC